MLKRTIIVTTMLTLACAATAYAESDDGESKGLNPRLLRRFKPIRPEIEFDGKPLSKEQIALGRMLYFDKRLSRGKDLSCNSCHPLDQYGSDGEKTSKGDKG